MPEVGSITGSTSITGTTGMIIKKINLQNFRNFKKEQISFDKKTTVIVGPNASGKTNILEAINLLSTGKSFRAGREEEMVRNGDEIARVSGEILPISTNKQINTNQLIKLEALLTRGEVNGKRVPHKKLSINGVGKRLYNFAGTLRVVLFGPWDLGLVTESPSTRRKFLDNVLSQVDREYRRSLLSYEKGVRQRNRLLERIRDGEASPSQLLFWNNLLIKNGGYLTEKREEFINFVNSTPSLQGETLQRGSQVKLEYDRSPISESRFEKYAEEEVAAATTLVGPHRDDIKFKMNATLRVQSSKFKIDRDLRVFGSRGEQRMAVLWLKLAELSFIEGKTQEKPVLLLDDIFSELDHEHRAIVMDVVGKQQTIITTADPHTIEKWRKRAQVIQL